MNQVKITESLDFAINNYLNYKSIPESIEYNGFFVVVIRLLCLIYDELDIVNPYVMNDSKTFDTNLCKYGYEIDKIIDFKEQLDNAYKYEKQSGVNSYFINIQKCLIDMLMARKDSIGLDDNRVTAFYALLYTNDNKNLLQISYNFRCTSDINEIKNYFYEQLEKHKKIETVKNREILNLEAYPFVGIEINQINNLSDDELIKINHQIYQFFGINEVAINKDYLLEQAIESHNREITKVTSGNGYVDILLIMSIIVTILMVVTVITMVLV